MATGKRRVLLSEPHSDFGSPRISPDGRFIACLREIHDTPDQPLDITLVLIDTEGPEDGAAQAGQTAAGTCCPAWTAGPTRRPGRPDCRTLYFTADDAGRGPVFRVDVDHRAVDRVTDDDGNYTDLNPAPDGRYLYALRSAMDAPPTPVRIDLTTGAEPAPLDCPGLPARTCRAGSTEVAGHRRRRAPDPGLAGAARGRLARAPRAAAAVGARRPAEQLELLVLAVEPVADGGPRLRRAAARPGPVHRLRPATSMARGHGDWGGPARTPTSWP